MDFFSWLLGLPLDYLRFWPDAIEKIDIANRSVYFQILAAALTIWAAKAIPDELNEKGFSVVGDIAALSLIIFGALSFRVDEWKMWAGLLLIIGSVLAARDLAPEIMQRDSGKVLNSDQK